MPQSDGFFSLQIDADKARFAEANGLGTYLPGPEYRHGNSPSFYPIKMPGLGRVSNVTMRKGIFVGDGALARWLDSREKRTISIALQDETGATAVTWTLNNAWPTQASVSSEGNEVAVESVDIAYETLTISAP